MALYSSGIIIKGSLVENEFPVPVQYIYIYLYIHKTKNITTTGEEGSIWLHVLMRNKSLEKIFE
jgi:hypothetical protein